MKTVAGESRDQVAVDHIMGHARDDMASAYRERISDERLEAVVEHVHKWVYPPKADRRAAKPQRTIEARGTGRRRRAVTAK